jgi:hypothetical protein
LIIDAASKKSTGSTSILDERLVERINVKIRAGDIVGLSVIITRFVAGEEGALSLLIAWWKKKGPARRKDALGAMGGSLWRRRRQRRRRRRFWVAAFLKTKIGSFVWGLWALSTSTKNAFGPRGPPFMARKPFDDDDMTTTMMTILERRG